MSEILPAAALMALPRQQTGAGEIHLTAINQIAKLRIAIITVIERTVVTGDRDYWHVNYEAQNRWWRS